MTHTRWTSGLNPMDRLDWIEIRKVSPKILAETRSWVQGYILALEDVIKDLETLLQAMQYGYSSDARVALEAATEKVQESLTSARATLSTLHDVIEGAGDGQELQAPAGEAEAP